MLPFSAGAGTASVLGFAGEIPRGGWTVEVRCSFHLNAAIGNGIAAFVMISPRGIVEFSAMSLVSWNHGGVAPVVTLGGSGIDAPPVVVTVVPETVTVRTRLSVGGPYHTYVSSLHGGCGSSNATMDGALLLNGIPVAADPSAQYVELRAAAFRGTAIGSGGTGVIAGGDAVVPGSVVAGAFEADAGALRALSPTGDATASSGLQRPEITLKGFGPWMLAVDWAEIPAGGALYRGLSFD